MKQERVEYRVKSAAQAIPPNHRLPPSAEEILAHIDEFGSTPPRTRIKNKYRDWDQKKKLDVQIKKDVCGAIMASVARTHSKRVNRRNTMDCAILNEMFVDDDSNKPFSGDKRSKQLKRESERDLKRASLAAVGPSASLSAAGAVVEATNVQLLGNECERHADSFPAAIAPTSVTAGGMQEMLINCPKKYKSVITRPVGCRTSAPPAAFAALSGISFAAGPTPLYTPSQEPIDETLQCRSDRGQLQMRHEFHETFANLIKLGSDKQDNRASKEINEWQTKLMDMIWLELQAWHAERTLQEQDQFLCASRQDVPLLLEKILNYRFKPSYVRETSNDSGISSATESSVEPNSSYSVAVRGLNNTMAEPDDNKCKRCISIYCKSCQMQQCTALREVEELLTRLEAAEALYPSSRAMGIAHPIYTCPDFVGRVKAMCLWYNITKYQRLKLSLVGDMFRRIQGKNFKWPDVGSDSGHSSGSTTAVSTMDNDVDSGRDSVDSRRLKELRTPIIPKVKFTIDGDTANDGSSSSSSSGASTPECSSHSSVESDNMPSFACGVKYPDRPLFAQCVQDVQNFGLDLISRNEFIRTSCTAKTSLYRRYIEQVLKTRGLGKSLSFLHRLHNVIIRRVQLTLERPGTDESEFDTDVFVEEFYDSNVAPIQQEQEEELRRYGVWSVEAQSLSLPSYAPTFVFLSVIPLEIMHEYLRMRIEARPNRPNPLSLEQLMKEVREGLILAMTHRERFNKHVHTALEDRDDALVKYMELLAEYDATVEEVMAMYLDYVEQYVLQAIPENQQKAAVVREWSFTKLIAPMIHGQHSVAAIKFGEIVGKMLSSISQRLTNRIEELTAKKLPVTNFDRDRMQVLVICREMQTMFSVERENAMRVMHFAKVLCRDLEQRDFHRDHEELDTDGEDASSPPSAAAAADRPPSYVRASVICEPVRRAAHHLQMEVLSVRHRLNEIIETVHRECNHVNVDDLDESDRLMVQMRTREILHQGFKFGFDYHKDMVRLFETKIVGSTDDMGEFNLSLGIIQFAKMWMEFVTTHCERGRGVRPRWAAQGLDFLIAACDPVNTKHLTEQQFDDLKAKMDTCITHVVGKVPEPERMHHPSPRARKPSASGRATPSPRIIGDETRYYYNQLSVREYPVSGSSAPNSPLMTRKQSSFVDGATSPSADGGPGRASTLKVPRSGKHNLAIRQIRIRDSVNHLDLQLEQKLRSHNLIGQVKTLNSSDKVHIRARHVTFSWHRGIKIGQGRFGKVYTAVNNTTGELMAMKEIMIQPNETRAIRNVAEELKIFEGISHKYLVKYYGVEVHREELLIFMELCAEGTLESLVELSGSLHEGLTRRYTAQLLTGVVEMHRHGVVHRDIKTANIFLTSGGNCLKLGDFGSAVKIQAQTTVPGELRGYVGTQAYMAPEVFTKTNTDGHGRAADIWSVGCVTIEMSSGKRPWAQFDSNFQIMFKVGMGESPAIPDDLSAEGHEFVEHCLDHDPKTRWTATELLRHNFCMVNMDACNDTTEPKRPPRKVSTTSKRPNLRFNT